MICDDYYSDEEEAKEKKSLCFFVVDDRWSGSMDTMRWHVLIPHTTHTVLQLVEEEKESHLHLDPCLFHERRLRVVATRNNQLQGRSC